MAIRLRFLSGQLEGREFTFPGDSVRIGDAPDADLRLADGPAHGRVVEVTREEVGYHIRSLGDRELSAQGEMPLDRVVPIGEEVRFGAWGPIFVLESPPSAAAPPEQRTAPIPRVSSAPGAPAAAAPAPMPAPTGASLLTPSGEKPVGPKTVHMMIQDALGKARETEGGALSRSTVFVRELITETIQNATRSLKIGLALLVAAIVILAIVLVWNIRATDRSIGEAQKAAAKRVESAKAELAGQLDQMKVEKDELARETQTVTKRIGELEKGAGASQAEVAALKKQLRDADERRRQLEGRMSQALEAAEKDRAALSAKLDQMERDRLAELERQRKAEQERRQREEQEARERADREARAAAEAQAAATASPAAPK